MKLQETRRGPKPESKSLNRIGHRRTFYVEDRLSNVLDLFCEKNSENVSSVVNDALLKYLDCDFKGSDKSLSDISVVSLFSGCGGMDLGFTGGIEFLGKKYDSLPFKIILSNDIVPSACEEYFKFFNHKPVLADIQDFLDDVEDLDKKERAKVFPLSCDVVIGGFPCQDFSVSGKRKGLSAKRGRLYQQMKRVIDLLNPKVFVAENVKGLMNLGEALETIKSDFQKTGKLGYEIRHELLHAANFGIPQTRERVFIIGIRKDLNDNSFKFPVPTHSPDPDNSLKQWVTAEKAIGDLITKTNIRNQHQYSKARNYGEHCQGNKKIKKDYPSPTIRAEHHGNIEFHYSENRRLTIRECARLQSFPDNYGFYSSPSAAYKLIGNAVPPVLAWHIAHSVKKAFEQWEKNV